MVTLDFRPEVEIQAFRACAMHPAIIIGTVRSLWMWLWDRYHVPQNAFSVGINFCCFMCHERWALHVFKMAARFLHLYLQLFYVHHHHHRTV